MRASSICISAPSQITKNRKKYWRLEQGEVNYMHVLLCYDMSQWYIHTIVLLFSSDARSNIGNGFTGTGYACRRSSRLPHAARSSCVEDTCKRILIGSPSHLIEAKGKGMYLINAAAYEMSSVFMYYMPATGSECRPSIIINGDLQCHVLL